MNALAIALAYQATCPRGDRRRTRAVVARRAGGHAACAVALAVSPCRALELRLLLAALGIGLLLESLWVGSGLLGYAAAWPWAGAPAWILALGCAFALVVVPLLGYLHRRPWLAAAFGDRRAAGVPGAAAGGWNAVHFAQPRWHGLLALGAGWALAMPALATLASARSARPPTGSTPLENLGSQLLVIGGRRRADGVAGTGSAANDNAGIVDVLRAAAWRARRCGWHSPAAASCRHACWSACSARPGPCAWHCICGGAYAARPRTAATGRCVPALDGDQRRFPAFFRVPGPAGGAVLAGAGGGGRASQPAVAARCRGAAAVSVLGESLGRRAAGTVPRRPRQSRPHL